MSIRTKQTIKRVGTMTLGALAVSGLVTIYGAILYLLNARIDTTQAKIEQQATVIQSVKNDTTWIKTYLCSKDKSSTCPIPTK